MQVSPSPFHGPKEDRLMPYTGSWFPQCDSTSDDKAITFLVSKSAHFRALCVISSRAYPSFLAHILPHY